MAWFLVTLAGLLEVTWAVNMKASMGLTRIGPAAVAIVGSIASFLLLSQAMRSIPVGTAYAVWTGIGAVGTTVLGMWLFEESRHPARLACLLLVIVGMAGLKYTATH